METNKDFLFEENEKVLVHHENNIYDAKVKKFELRVSKSDQKKKPYYYIHYLGWNEKWNEWVEGNRMLKLNDKNKEWQVRVNSTSKKYNMEDMEFDSDYESDSDSGSETSSNTGGGGSSSSSNKPITSLSSKRKKKLEQVSNTGGGSSSSVTPSTTTVTSSSTPKPNNIASLSTHIMEIIIPLSLKGALVDDWGFISNDKSLVKLPRSPNINEIFSEYVKVYKKNPELDETSEGLKSYFNKALGTMLLYKFERIQYKEMLKGNPNKDLCEIYGAEHLLRLFVKLPKLLSTFKMEEETVNVLKKDFDDILSYLEKNQDTLFLKQYISPSAIYLKQSNV